MSTQVPDGQSLRKPDPNCPTRQRVRARPRGSLSRSPAFARRIPSSSRAANTAWCRSASRRCRATPTAASGLVRMSPGLQRLVLVLAGTNRPTRRQLHDSPLLRFRLPIIAFGTVHWKRRTPPFRLVRRLATAAKPTVLHVHQASATDAATSRSPAMGPPRDFSCWFRRPSVSENASSSLTICRQSHSIISGQFSVSKPSKGCE